MPLPKMRLDATQFGVVAFAATGLSRLALKADWPKALTFGVLAGTVTLFLPEGFLFGGLGRSTVLPSQPDWTKGKTFAPIRTAPRRALKASAAPKREAGRRTILPPGTSGLLAGCRVFK